MGFILLTELLVCYIDSIEFSETKKYANETRTSLIIIVSSRNQ